MLKITAKFFQDDELGAGWRVINGDGRGYSDVLELARLAGVAYKRSPLATRHKTKQSAMGAAKHYMAMASAKTGGAYEAIT